MTVNLKCGVCKHIYDFEIGKPSMDKNYRLVFEIKPICPKCQVSNKELLTELGQSQMTAWHLGGM
jgi:rubredoxin